jgi:hypothetical protein
MVVYDVVDQRGIGTTFTSTAYATMKGHWLSGEERVTVALRDGSQDVDVEILSISRAGPSLWGRTVWPFVGKEQSTFFQEHLQHLAETAAGSGSTRDSRIDNGVVNALNTPTMGSTRGARNQEHSTTSAFFFPSLSEKSPIPKLDGDSFNML